jgi:enoyl-[acyl-carrier protein] reductase II
MHEGDMNEGELEIGQVSSLIDKIIPAADVVSEIIAEFEATKNEISNIKF